MLLSNVTSLGDTPHRSLIAQVIKQQLNKTSQKIHFNANFLLLYNPNMKIAALRCRLGRLLEADFVGRMRSVVGQAGDPELL